MLESNHYSVLFTGGLDSAYRLCQLARDKKAIVQPVYILFPNDGKSSHIRPEMQREIEAQDKILDYIIHHSNTKATFLPIRRVHRDELPTGLGTDMLENRGNVYNWIIQLSRGGLGWQYYYIALYSKWDKGVELCQEMLPRPFENGNIQFYTDNLGRKRIAMDKFSGKGANYFEFLFNDLAYPIIGVTRQEMKDNLDKWGYSEIWNQIWFCYHSVDGEPCGVCDNCFFKLEQGLSFLFSKEAIHRYHVCKVIKKFSDDRLKGFFEANVVHGEEAYKKAIIRESVENQWGLRDFFLCHPFLLEKMYKKTNKNLDRIANKCHSSEDACKMIM